MIVESILQQRKSLLIFVPPKIRSIFSFYCELLFQLCSFKDNRWTFHYQSLEIFPVNVARLFQLSRPFRLKPLDADQQTNLKSGGVEAVFLFQIIWNISSKYDVFTIRSKNGIFLLNKSHIINIVYKAHGTMLWKIEYSFNN